MLLRRLMRSHRYSCVVQVPKPRMYSGRIAGFARAAACARGARDDERAGRAAGAPGRAHPAPQRRRDVRRGHHLLDRDQAVPALGRLRVVHGPFLTLHLHLGEVLLGGAELVHVAAGELGVDGRDGRAVGKLELRAGVGGSTDGGGIDEQLHRVACTHSTWSAAPAAMARPLAEQGVDAGAVEDLGRHAHRHLQVRGEDVVPLRPAVGPRRAAGQQDVDLVLADTGVAERGPARLGGELQRVFHVLLVGVGVAHAEHGGDAAERAVEWFQAQGPPCRIARRIIRTAARAAWR